METPISDFYTSFYIPATQNISFHLSPVLILGTNHCGNTRLEALKRRRTNQDGLCYCVHDERVIANCAHQIHYECYVSNRSVYIEDILLDHFSEPTQIEAEATPQSLTYHYLFSSFLTGYSKQYYATTIAYVKRTITLMKQCNIMYAKLSRIWENTDGCSNHYRCATTLYLI